MGRRDDASGDNGHGGTQWTRRRRAVLDLRDFLLVLWRTHRGFASAIVAARAARAGLPVALFWVAKAIIDEVVRLTQTAGDPWTLWKYVTIEILLVVLGELLSRASMLLESLFGDLFTHQMSVRLMRHSATLDLEQFETPSVYDKLERARNETSNRVSLIAQLLGVCQSLVTLGVLCVALLTYSVWLGLLLLLAVLPGLLGEARFAALEYSLIFRFTPQRRELGYLRYVAAGDLTAKENQILGLAGWLTDRYDRLSRTFYKENKVLAIRRATASTVLSLVGAAGYYTAYISILRAAAHGAITLGQLTFLTASFSRSRDIVNGLVETVSQVFEQSLYLRDLFDFFELRPRIASAKDAPRAPVPVVRGYRFEDVGFKYPGTDGWAVRHVSFVIRPGERVALVGENGAGKTTIVKLLTRLYDPTEGRITLDGVDLRAYDLTSLREAAAVVFQDFVRFDMRFDENIGVGRIGDVREYLDAARRTNGLPDMPTNGNPVRASTQQEVPALIRVAAERSFAERLVSRFPEGYRQMLGRHFHTGIDLSGGEWQKVAIARAYMRDAQLLILDEPTAALDPRAEYELSGQFDELTRGRMAVVISHRFSTLRIADRIVVLVNGSVSEEGTHWELMRRQGPYAELFSLQAGAYQ